MPLAFICCVPCKLGRTNAFGNVEPNVVRCLRAGTLPCGTRHSLLIVHRGFKTGLINAKALRTQRVFGQVIWKAICVIKLERGIAGKDIAWLHARGGFIKQLNALVQRAAELGFFLLQRRFNHRLRAQQFGIGGAHFSGKAADQTVHQRLFRTKDVRMAHGAAHDAAQNIAATFVRRHNAIGQQEAGRAQMVGNHAVAGHLVALRLCAGQLFRRIDQRLERVRIVIVVHALHDRRDALKPHAGIDRRLGQRHIGAVILPLELHEHEVPYFDKTVAIFIRASGRATKDMVAMVIKNFAAWTAWPRVAHRPEIIVRGDTDNAVFRKARNLAPQVECLIIGVIDRRRQARWIKAPFLGQQCPRMGNRLLFEIIAEREVPEHFKECVVARRVADIVQIIMLAARTHTFLA